MKCAWCGAPEDDDQLLIEFDGELYCPGVCDVEEPEEEE